MESWKFCDDALDWVNDFSNQPSKGFIESTLKAAIESDEYLEAPESSMAIAAAEVVAALRDAPHPTLPDEIQAVLSSSEITIDQSLIDLALKAVERVKANSWWGDRRAYKVERIRDIAR